MSWPPLGVKTNAIHNRSSQLYSIKFASLPKYNKKLLGHWLVLLCHSSWVGRWQAVYEECKWPATLQNTSVRTINPQSRRPSQAAPWERLLYLCADFVVYALEEDFAQHVDRHLRHCYSCEKEFQSLYLTSLNHVRNGADALGCERRRTEVAFSFCAAHCYIQGVRPGVHVQR